MRERLEDASDTLRKRKKLPSSKLNIWRLNNQSKKDQIFNEPLLSGNFLVILSFIFHGFTFTFFSFLFIEESLLLCLCLSAGFSDDLRSVFEKDCVSSKPYLAVPDETVTEPASVSSPTREAETEVNPTSPIPQSTVPDSTSPDRTVQLSPDRQTEDVHQSAHAESVARQAQSPMSSNNGDTGIEHLREGGYPEYMRSPAPRSSPARTDDFTTQPGSRETGSSYRTEPSASTNSEDLRGQRNSGLSDIPEMQDEVCSHVFLCFVFTTSLCFANTESKYHLYRNSISWRLVAIPL